MTKVPFGLTIPKTRRTSPADWGIGMTVCVAAISGAYSDECCLVMAMDQMISTGYVNVDLRLSKGMRIHEKWYAMYAGDDVQYAGAIIIKATEALRGPTLPASDVLDTFLSVYRAQRQRVAEQSVLSPLGLTMTEYISMISENDNEVLREITRKLNAVSFSLSFLLCGFDQLNGRIFSIQPPGVEGSYEPIGFWAIGSGAEIAINNLLVRKYAMDMSLTDAIYHVAESKFTSEVAPNVGTKSVITVLRPDGRLAVITRQRSDAIRKIWEEEGRAPIPKDLDSRIKPLVEFFQMPLPKP